MGTKIERAIDPLATSTNRNSNFTLQYRVDDWNYLQARKLKKFDNNFSDSMDRLLEKHNIESIKKTMQIHAEIFKHQVQELHRLYSVHKRLMGELKKESKQNPRNWSSSEMNHSHQFMNKMNNHATTQTNSGGGFDLERPADLEDNNYISTAVSAIEDKERVHAAAGPSNKMSIDHGSGSDVELTLSIGVSSSNSSKNKKKS